MSGMIDKISNAWDYVASKTYKREEAAEQEPVVADKSTIGEKVGEKFDNLVDKMKEKAGKLATFTNLVQRPVAHGVEVHEPKAGAPQPRNNASVVLVHGTVTDKECFREYLDAALKAGHMVDLSSYSTITNGARLQKNAQAVSKRINDNRVHTARDNMQLLRSIRNEPEKLKEFFKLDGNLYGKPDPATEKIAALLPSVIDRVDQILDSRSSTLENSYSGKIKGVENWLSNRIEETGFGKDAPSKEMQHEVCRKAASEIMDSISPKVTLVGHSLGGFTSYLLTLNPKDGVSDKSQFTYDGGNGVGAVLTLSGPLHGVRAPLPPMVANAGFDLVNEHALSWFEHLPSTEFVAQIPLVAGVYKLNKKICKAIAGKMTDVGLTTLSPAVYPFRPGYKELRDKSDFLETHVNHKKVPEGVTVVAFTSKSDGICEEKRSGVDESQPNANNLSITDDIPEEYDKPMPVPDEILTKSVLAHLQFLMEPDKHLGEFQERILENPDTIPKLLHRSNYDGIRFDCLQLLLDKVTKDEHYLDKPEMKHVRQAVTDVATEKLPFKDSPSYLAQQIMNQVDSDPKTQCTEKPKLDDWFISH